MFYCTFSLSLQQTLNSNYLMSLNEQYFGIMIAMGLAFLFSLVIFFKIQRKWLGCILQFFSFIGFSLILIFIFALFGIVREISSEADAMVGVGMVEETRDCRYERTWWMKPDDILISEEFGCGKPDERCYRYFADRYPGAAFAYVGDNLNKDFVTANALGWTTICLIDNGRNIFSQQVEGPERYLPQHSINDISELKNFMCGEAISSNL